MMKAAKGKKWTDASDDKSDKKMGIKEGSKRDVALDKKRGVAETTVKGKTPSFMSKPMKAKMTKMPKGKKAV